MWRLKILQKWFAECATLPAFCPLEATMHSKNTYVCVIKEETNSASEKIIKQKKSKWTIETGLYRRCQCKGWTKLTPMHNYRKYLPLIKQRNCLCEASCIKASFSFSFADWGNPPAGWMPLGSDFCSLTLAHTLQMWHPSAKEEKKYFLPHLLMNYICT